MWVLYRQYRVRKQTESESRNMRRTRQQDDKANQKKSKDILMTDGFRDIEKLESDLWEAAELAAKIQSNFEELGI
jgi:hypothetical protein